MNLETKSLIKKQKPVNKVNADIADGIEVGMNFADRFITIELDSAELDNTTILTLPIDKAYQMALKVYEACVIINFANSIGLSLEESESNE